jgi:hypothetical protein
MRRKNLPDGFAPDALLSRLESRRLKELGFKPGYRICALAMDTAVEFDLFWLITTITSPETEIGAWRNYDKPKLPFWVIAPDGVGSSDRVPATMRIDDIGRRWVTPQASYWHLSGWLAWDGVWRIGRKTVQDCPMRVAIHGSEGYVQFTPRFRDGHQQPESDEFRWESRLSHMPPTKKSV